MRKAGPLRRKSLRIGKRIQATEGRLFLSLNQLSHQSQPVIELIRTLVQTERWPVFLRKFFRRRIFCTTSFGPFSGPITSATTLAPLTSGEPRFS